MKISLHMVSEYVARILFASIFISAGIGKFVDTAAVQALMATVGIPGVLIWPAAIVDLAIALALVSGFLWRPALVGGALYCIALGLIFHLRPESQNDMINLFKNFSIAGGMILLALRSD